MKKVLSVALASSMVLGLGMNAFALEYNSGSSDKANWPTNFQFDGELFVTDEDDNLVTNSSTLLGQKETADFRPGDVIWMPLYANDQYVYGVTGNTQGTTGVSAGTFYIPAVDSVDKAATDGKLAVLRGTSVVTVEDFTIANGDYVFGYGNTTADRKVVSVALVAPNGTITDKVADLYDHTEAVAAKIDKIKCVDFTATGNAANKYVWSSDNTPLSAAELADGTLQTAFNALASLNAETADITRTPSVPEKWELKDGVKVRVSTPAVSGTSASDGKIIPDVQVGEPTSENVDVNHNKLAYGPYTGNIDKNWSINLLEKTKGAEEVIDSAEFYRADASDVAMYGNKVTPNAVYVKVTLKDFFDSVNDATLKYYVYVSDNNGSTKDKTNEVWVSGKYENENEKIVDFNWSNNANSPAVWKVAKGENGTAVFDFEDKVFFTVKMYSEEKMYLDLSTAYDKVVAGDFSEADFDSFFKFEGTNANFSREGQLLLASDDEDLFAYEIDADGNLIPVDAEYVKDYKIAHTNTKANGYLFNTKELGNYVLSATELEADEEEAPEEEPEDNNNDVVEEPTPDETEKPAPTPEKPNPNTGANDFVGVAVALAVVSVAAAGALALKK